MTDRVPIQRLGEVLLVSIQTDLDDQAVLNLQDDLAERVSRTGAHHVVIDISAVEIVDSFVGRMLATIAAIARVLDAQTVVVGMRPAVAITLVELGLSLGSVRTALSLDSVLRDMGRAGDGADDEDDAGPADQAGWSGPRGPGSAFWDPNRV
ncbi:MAG TPA: STAS domain-containing protein [Actinocrinis sp.]